MTGPAPSATASSLPAAPLPVRIVAHRRDAAGPVVALAPPDTFPAHCAVMRSGELRCWGGLIEAKGKPVTSIAAAPAEQPGRQAGDRQALTGDFLDQPIGVIGFTSLSFGTAQSGQLGRDFEPGQSIAERAGKQYAVAAVLVGPGQTAAGALWLLAGQRDAQGEAACQGEIADLVTGRQGGGCLNGAAAQQTSGQQQGETQVQGRSFLMVPARTSLSGLALAASLRMRRASSLRFMAHSTSPRWAAISGSALMR